MSITSDTNQIDINLSTASLQTDGVDQEKEHQNPLEYYGGIPLLNNDNEPDDPLNKLDKKVAAQGMFIHMNKPSDGRKLKEGKKMKKEVKQEEIEVTPDYSQNTYWGNFLYHFYPVAAFLRLLGTFNSIEFGGMTHRNYQQYRLETLGLIWFVIFICLFATDIFVVKPIYFENDVDRVMTDHRNVPADQFINPTIQHFNDQTEFQLKIYSQFTNKKLTCSQMRAVLYTYEENVHLNCVEVLHHSVAFTLPEEGKSEFHIEGIKLFKDPKHLFNHLVSIECSNTSVQLCRDENYQVELQYKQLVPSVSFKEGVTKMTKIQRESLMNNESFKFTIPIQKVNVAELDSNFEVVGKNETSVQIESNPQFQVIDTPTYYPKTLGQVEIYEENYQMDIFVQRKFHYSHFAILAAVNLFWIIFFKMLLQCFVDFQFQSSLRKEINPNVTK